MAIIVQDYGTVGGNNIEDVTFKLINSSPYGISDECRYPKQFFTDIGLSKLTPTIGAGNAYIYTYSDGGSTTTKVALTSGTEIDITSYIEDSNDGIVFEISGANALTTFVLSK